MRVMTTTLALVVQCSSVCIFDALRTNGVASETAGCVVGRIVGDQVVCAFSCADGRATATCLGTSWFPTSICNPPPAPNTSPPPPPVCEGVKCVETECRTAECNQISGVCDMSKPDDTPCITGGTICISGVCGTSSSSSSNTTLITIIVIVFVLCVALCVGGGFWRCRTHLHKIETAPPKKLLKKKQEVDAFMQPMKTKPKPVAYEEHELQLRGKKREHGCIVSTSLAHDNKLCLSGVVPDGNAERSGFASFIGRTILTVGNRPVFQEADFDRELGKSVGNVMIGFDEPGMYTVNGLARDTLVEIHSLQDSRELNGETGKVVDSWGTGLSVYVKGKGVKYVPLENAQVMEGTSAEQVKEYVQQETKKNLLGPTALFPPADPSEITLKKKRGDDVGLRLQSMVLVGMRLGSAADTNRLTSYLGRKVVQVNGIPVWTSEELSHITIDEASVEIAFGPEERIDVDGRTMTLDAFLAAHGTDGVRRWGLAKKLHEIQDKRSYGRGRGMPPPTKRHDTYYNTQTQMLA
eukprot:TRINITY_DN19912_c0_g1_i1.p1 TRINITY_DN19912_c0_g1~~TRINITY_DN19912_c0_g1_i1.p1  ORF type:complete len:523 (+),score=133.73 TRINITY_DN19912_c0_g1_i1:67-1635(+)